jgi:predicted flap endonuclease-1-like 5' DNA nuclease
MPKKGRKTKKIDSTLQRSLSKKFVKTRSHKRLTDRVETLEKEIAELRRLLTGGQAKTVMSEMSNAEGQKDDLQRIKGIGAVLEESLHAIGIHSFKQIAAWSQTDIDHFSQQLSFKGRIEREAWVKQAGVLAAE